jgi:hypothetical protein
MPGKRIASQGEDRARKPAEDRGARKRKLRFGEKNPTGFSAKDEARAKAWSDT